MVVRAGAGESQRVAGGNPVPERRRARGVATGLLLQARRLGRLGDRGAVQTFVSAARRRRLPEALGVRIAHDRRTGAPACGAGG
eukprot:480498-Prymnesium_polylepis.1